MRKRKSIFLLLACLLLTLAAGCGKAPQQPQEHSKWDILSAKCGEADCTVSVTKNWGGQETGLSCVVTIPRSDGMDMTAVPLTLTPSGTTGTLTSLMQTRPLSAMMVQV